MGDIFPVFLQVAKHKYVKAHSQPLPAGCVLLIFMSSSGQATSPAPFAVRQGGFAQAFFFSNFSPGQRHRGQI